MWKIRDLHIRNFRLLKDSHLGLDRLGLVHVGAVNKDLPHADSNQSGKSTLLHAISWCCYGCDTLGNPLSSNVVSEGEDSCLVVIHLVDEDRKMRIARLRRNNPKRALQEETNALEVHLPGRPALTQDEAQRAIVAELGPKELFLAAHIFGYEEGYTPFARKPEREQKSLFEQLVENEDLLSALDRVGVERRHSETFVRQADAYIERIRGWLDGATSQLAESVDETAVRKVKTEISVAHSDVLLMETQVSNTDRQLKERETELNRLKRREYELNAELSKLALPKEAYDRACDERKRRSLEVSELDNCPTCGVQLDKTLKANMLSKAREAVAKTLKAYDKASQNLGAKELIRELEEVEYHMRDEQSEVDRLKDRLATRQKRLHEAKKAEAGSKLALKVLERNVAQRAAGLAQRVFARRSQLEVAEELAQEEEARLADLAFWEDGFGHGGIRAHRLDQLTPILNELAMAYSMELFGDGTHAVYTTQSKTKAGELRDRFSMYLADGDGRKIEVLSAGQAMRRDLVHLFATVALAGRLGRRKVDFLAFDETFRTLDRSGKEAVMRILQSLAEEIGTILVLEHDDEMAAHFNTKLVLTRSEGVAEISS